ncbi:MAG TPA: class I SAM-dependent methyltransferase [Chitinophagaceae bacterium]|nr:class I SAM-dependent methyltransferase [Chitinophagaceae bacterium]
MKDILQQLQPTERFTGLVDNYAKYRPSYPPELIDFIEQETGLQKDWNIADVGSGTGIFSRLLLERGYKVYGVEPNKNMREAAESGLVPYKKFTSIDATGEKTTLQGRSIDLITVAQAFHWINAEEAKLEFRRILKPPGYVALIWNIRTTNTPFLAAFEQLKIDYGTDYKATRMLKENDIASFFEPGHVKYACFPHYQRLDYEALKGQLLSTSYVPQEGKKHDEMIEMLESLFSRYVENELVKIEYEAKVYLRVEN